MTDMTRRKLLSAAGSAAGAAIFTPVVAVLELRAQEALIRSTHFGGPYQALNDIVGKPFTQMGFGRVEYDAALVLVEQPSDLNGGPGQRGREPMEPPLS